MKKKILFLFVALLFSGCASTKTAITGEFKGEIPWADSYIQAILFLNPDKSFDLEWNFDYYSGVWESVGKNQIILKFDKITDPSILLASGTLSREDKKIIIINKNKLKIHIFRDITLKRQK